MSYQGSQARQSGECRTVGESRLNGVETRQLQAANQVSVERRRVHDAIVAGAAASSVVNGAPEPTSTHHNSIDVAVAIPLALSRAGLSHKQACAWMGVDTGLWSKQLQGDGHVSLQRLLRLQVAFWCEFLPMLAEPAGLAVSHDDIADLALKQAAVAFDALARSVAQLRAQRRSA